MQKKVFDFKSWLIFEAKRPRLPKKSLDNLPLPLPEETPKRFEPDPGMPKNYDRGARSFGGYSKPEEPEVQISYKDLEGKECVGIVLQYLPNVNLYRGLILPSEIFFPSGIAAKNLDNRSLLPLSDVLFTGTREEIFIRYNEERADLKKFYQEFHLEIDSAKNPREAIDLGDIVKGIGEFGSRSEINPTSLFLFDYEKIGSLNDYRESKIPPSKDRLVGKECVGIVLQFLPNVNLYRGLILPNSISDVIDKKLDKNSLALSNFLLIGTGSQISAKYKEERNNLRNFYREFHLDPENTKNPQKIIKTGDIVKGIGNIGSTGKYENEKGFFLLDSEKIGSLKYYEISKKKEPNLDNIEYFNFSFGDAYGSETSVACTIGVPKFNHGKNISTKNFRFFAYTEDGKKTMLPFYEIVLVTKTSSGYVFLSKDNEFFYTDGSLPIEFHCDDNEIPKEKIESTIIDFLEDTTESHPNQYKFYPKSLRKAWFMMALNRLFDEYSFDYSGFEKEEAMEDIKRNFRKVFGEVIEKDQIDISPSGYKKMRFAYIGREAFLALENLGLKLPGDIPREDQKFPYDIASFFPFYPEGNSVYFFLPFAEFLSPVIWEFATKEDLALKINN